MALDRDPRRLLVVGDASKTLDEDAAASIVLAREITGTLLLESVAARASGAKCSFPEAVRMIVAESILELNIPDGLGILFPVSLMVQRTAMDPSVRRDTLFTLRKRVHDESDPQAILLAGIRLGDEATHFAAGFFGNRKLRDVMTSDQQREYAQGMAHTGYDAALNAARRTNRYETRFVINSVPPILERFGDVVAVLALLVRRRVRDLSVS